MSERFNEKESAFEEAAKWRSVGVVDGIREIIRELWNLFLEQGELWNLDGRTGMVI